MLCGVHAPHVHCGLSSWALFWIKWSWTSLSSLEWRLSPLFTMFPACLCTFPVLLGPSGITQTKAECAFMVSPYHYPLPSQPLLPDSRTSHPYSSLRRTQLDAVLGLCWHLACPLCQCSDEAAVPLLSAGAHQTPSSLG